MLFFAAYCCLLHTLLMLRRLFLLLMPLARADYCCRCYSLRFSSADAYA